MPIFDTILKPTLVLNETVARQNLHRMASRARAANVSFRPHFKTHQSLEIGEWFRAEGVTAITVSSLDMAEYFASGGWADILLAFPVNLRQIAALDSLAARVRLGLLVESVETVHALAARLSHPVDIWLKIDTGTGRTGLSWQDTPAVQAVITAVLSEPCTSLARTTHSRRRYLQHLNARSGCRDPPAFHRPPGRSCVKRSQLRALRHSSSRWATLPAAPSSPTLPPPTRFAPAISFSTTPSS